MARRASRPQGGLSRGSLVLDSAGLSLAVDRDPMVLARLKSAWERDYRVVVSTLTIIEAQHPKLPMSRLDFVLSKINVLDVTEPIAREATRLLREAGLHGHEYAIDAVVAATALRQPGPVSLITSDLDDMAQLCGKRVLLVPV